MATVTKTFTENFDASNKATWTVSMTVQDISVGSSANFTLPALSGSAKYVYAGKQYAGSSVNGHIYIDGIAYSSSSYWFLWERSFAKATSGTAYTLTQSASAPSQAVSKFFNSTNPTVKTLPLTLSASVYLESSKNYDRNDMYNMYDSGTLINWGTLCNVTLNAPPTFTSSTLSKDTADYYAGLTTVSVTISDAVAQYGGNITSSALTIGGQTVTGNGNGILSMILANAGTFTPTVSVTDSRGQTTTTTLTQITVNQYTVPSLAFNVIRSNSNGVPDDEGVYGVATATINYTDFIADLTQPTVTVTDENGTAVVTTVTWYDTWTSVAGVSGAVNWTNYNPDAPITLYGLISGSFSPNETYTVTIVANDSEGGASNPITQSLSTGFFTIDFQAGGKEIAFGAPANDDLTLHPNGLFKCNMDAWFNGDVHMQGGGFDIQRASIPSSSFSFESGHGSGTIGGDGLHIVKFGEMICFYGQINASNFVKGTSGTPYVQTAKPSFMPANKAYSPVGIHRSGGAGSGTLSASAWALRDRIWITTDDTYLHIRSANFLGDSANGYLEMLIFGATFHIDGAF